MTVYTIYTLWEKLLDYNWTAQHQEAENLNENLFGCNPNNGDFYVIRKLCK
jgi:hypothetical protein